MRQETYQWVENQCNDAEKQIAYAKFVEDEMVKHFLALVHTKANPCMMNIVGVANYAACIRENVSECFYSPVSDATTLLELKKKIV